MVTHPLRLRPRHGEPRTKVERAAQFAWRFRAELFAFVIFALIAVAVTLQLFGLGHIY